MTRISPFVFFIALFFNTTVLLKTTDGVPPSRGKYRPIVSNNAPYDPCIRITKFSGEEDKVAADRECKQAFLSLDHNNVNSCRGWRQAECRPFPDSPNRQCSCVISVCNESGVVSDETRSFRRCALDLRPDRYFAGQVAPPSGFQELLKGVESKALAKSAHNSFSAGSSSGGGSSNVPNTPEGGRIPSRPSSIYDAGTSSVKSAGVGGKIYTCNVCFNVYKSPSALINHKKCHTEHLVCYSCKKRFANKTNFTRHIKQTHKGDKEAVSRLSSDTGLSPEFLADYLAFKESRPHICGVCGTGFSWEKSLKSHMKSHESLATTCTLCNITYSTPAEYMAHMKDTHQGKFP